ncbi:NACHT, LRR and PYD domains-containing protein 9-like [Branchiostoma floridae]|uniref:NACHT, LRR and PYD domains-containing protein 9-like n=1 Tax=Branchiostoma floridae TaxID=7739 RepID=A0A9J7MHL9_BRAFL|nr:NACHT, LRR and PYD domains-containing protein 9-like [Branchiostoma floridae]
MYQGQHSTPADSERKEPRVFVIHTGEDKDSFVRPLVSNLQQQGLAERDIFFDDVSIRPGDVIRDRIIATLSSASLELAVIVVSSSFLNKPYWPKLEFETCLKNNKQIFPIWVDANEDNFKAFSESVGRYSPTLKQMSARRVQRDDVTSELPNIAAEIVQRLSTLRHGHNVTRQTGSPCTVEDVINTLKDLYATEYANMRPLPWCEDLNLPLREVYTNLQYQRRDDRGHFKDTGMIVSLEDIYKTSKGQAKNDDARSGVRRIRVEGDPGIGKSCSCQKLAHDWSSGKLDDFKAVLFLEMRHMSGKVKDAIFEQLLPEDTNMTQDQLWSYIQENQDDVLFILDGLDELSQTAREVTDVMALIQGKILRNCHVLVTSRPYHCVKDLEKCHEFYKIVGYSIKNSFEFIQKYFSKTPETATKLSDQLFRHQNLSRIAVNPLNNVLICIVWEDNVNEGRVPTSPAELYEMIVYSVAKRYCAKKDIQLEGDRFPTNVEQALRCLRKLSWEGLQQDQLQFNIDDIKEKFGHNADDMLAIGLLTRDNSFSRIKRTHFCAFLHKTFQEYLAAYYVSEWVKQESTSKAGIEYLRSLFGMTKATACNVDIELMSANRERYREVQNMLLSVLGDSSGLLFELFAEELSKDGCKEDKNLLSFFCITFLGRTCEAGKAEFRLAEIVAPCLPQHITNDVWGHAACNSFKFDHVEWIDGEQNLGDIDD